MTSASIAPWLSASRWPTVPIRFVAKLGTGHTPSRNVSVYWENCTVPWVTLADVWQLRDGAVDVIEDTKEKISRLGLANSSAVKHPVGTVILSRTASVGFSAILGKDMATTQDFATWTCGPNLDARYLLHALRAMAPDLKRVAAGSTHKTIYMPDIEQLRIPLPPISEQRRIADHLDDAVVRLDQVRRSRLRQQENLVERAFATVSEILMPGILDRPTGVGEFPWLPELPGAVKLIKLGFLCRLQSGLTIDGARDIGGEVVTRPYLRVANVQAGRIKLDEVAQVTVPRALADKCTLRAGDVLMTEGGDLDKLGRGTVWNAELPECLHQNHVFALRVNPEKLDASYLAYMTQTVHGRCYFESTGTRTTNLASTNSAKILGFPLPLPVVERQRELVCEVQAALNASDQANSVLARQLVVIAERRQELITAAVTGRIDVSTARRIEV